MLAHELAEHLVDLVGSRGVELAGRLVREEHARPVGERRAERNALLLAARQLARPPVALRAEPDALEQLVGARAAALRRGAPRRPSWSATSRRAESSGASARA